MAVSDGFDALALPRTATSREVKRAYARLLKATRPDEDAQAFQRLNEAYEHALAMATWRERQAEAPIADALEAPPEAPPAAAPSRRRRAPRPARSFALDPFLDELARQLGVAGRLRGWLQQHEALWDLELKQALALPMAHALPVRDFPLDEDEFEAIRQFFGIDATLLHRHHLSAHWHLIERRARAHAHDRARLERIEVMARSGSNRYGLGEGVRAPDTSFWLDDIAWQELYARPDPARRFMLKMLPTGPLRAARMLRDLERRIGVEAAAKVLEHGGQAYWRRAGDIGRYAPERLWLGAQRLGLLGGTWLLAQGYLAQIMVIQRPPHPLDLVVDVASSVFAIGATWAAIGAVATGVLRWRRGRAP